MWGDFSAMLGEGEGEGEGERCMVLTIEITWVSTGQ